VPGSIRRAEHFVIYLKKLVEFLKKGLAGSNAEEHTPLSFLHKIQDATALERKPLRFTYSRLNSLLRTLEVTSLDDFAGLTQVANFATLLATYLEGFSVILEPQGSVVAGVQEPLLQLCCLDASIAIKPCLDRFQSVIITSGTLSPIDLYPKLLGFQPVVRTSLPMSVFRHCLLPLIVTKGSDQTPITTAFEKRKDENVVRNYGQLVLETCTHVPDGICVFFTSYQFMEHTVTQWDAMGLMQEIVKSKLVFLETKDVVETTLALDNYKRACDCGRGAVFLSVARGKVAEGIDFDRHYGRAVLLLGIPYQYTKSKVLRSRLDFMSSNYQIRDQGVYASPSVRPYLPPSMRDPLSLPLCATLSPSLSPFLTNTHLSTLTLKTS
jgi:DNA excision repair protein ERCC-2